MEHQGYSTKEMCEIFSVGRETLRYYESLGLLHPQINSENGYRTYDYWDIATMIDILKYRSVGFSVKDTRNALFHMEYSQIIGALEQQQDSYRDQIQKYQMLEKKTSIDLRYLHYLHGEFGKLYEFDMEDIRFIPFLNPMNAGGKEEIALFQKIFHNSQFFATSWIIDAYPPDDCALYGIGMSTEREFADYLNIYQGVVIGKSRVVGTFLDVQGHELIGPDTFRPFHEQVQRQYLNSSMETYAILMSRFYDQEQVYHQYVYVYKKLKVIESSINCP